MVADTGVAPHRRGNYFLGFVSRCVVVDADLEVRIGLVEHALNRAAQQLRPPISGNDRRYKRVRTIRHYTISSPVVSRSLPLDDETGHTTRRGRRGSATPASGWRPRGASMRPPSRTHRPDRPPTRRSTPSAERQASVHQNK